METTVLEQELKKCGERNIKYSSIYDNNLSNTHAYYSVVMKKNHTLTETILLKISALHGFMMQKRNWNSYSNSNTAGKDS